jgi:hypothetical protein
VGKKLLVYLIDGTEYGPRTIEIGNWIGRAIYCNRASINQVLTRKETLRPGIYIFRSSPSHTSYNERIYIGEAEVVATRIKQQMLDPKKDFEELVIFTSKDDFLTKAHIKYLEARLVSEAHEAKSAEIVNVTKPNLPVLHEAEISDLEYFIEQIKLILPLMGFKFLLPLVVKEKMAQIISDHNPIGIYHIRSPSLQASMNQTPRGFVVLKGSQAKTTIGPAVSETYKALRKQLIDQGLLILKDGYLEFTKDTIFSSPTAAANVVLGRQTPGPITWLNSDNKTLKEILQEE